MKTNFVYNKEIEYQRILMTLGRAYLNLYQEHGFLVLPYKINKYAKSIYLPEIKNLDYQFVFDKLKKLVEIYKDLPFKEKNNNLDNLIKILKEKLKLETPDKKNIKKVEKQWLLIQPQFEDYFLELFPSYRQYSINLTIYWSCYGSLVSFNEARSYNKKTFIEIFVRDDMGIEAIAEGFLSSFFLDELNNKLAFSWIQNEAIIDFLLLKTKLNRLFPNYIPTIAKYSKKFLQDYSYHYENSIKYLKKLGISRNQFLSLVNDQVLINGQIPKYLFSAVETKILKKLIQETNKPVSYYDLGDIVWSDDIDKFSLWALTKTINRIRNKIRANGLSPDHIKNIRGVGYLYTNHP